MDGSAWNTPGGVLTGAQALVNALAGWPIQLQQARMQRERLNADLEAQRLAQALSGRQFEAKQAESAASRALEERRLSAYERQTDLQGEGLKLAQEREAREKAADEDAKRQWLTNMLMQAGGRQVQNPNYSRTAAALGAKETIPVSATPEGQRTFQELMQLLRSGGVADMSDSQLLNLATPGGFPAATTQRGGMNPALGGVNDAMVDQAAAEFNRLFQQRR